MKDINRTYKEAYYWAYANLAMGHIAYKDSAIEYSSKYYSIRKKIYSDLLIGKINIRSIFDDEKVKIALANVCSYCGSKEKIATDHVIPKNKGGMDSGDNLIPACQTCNSSKRDIDVLTWLRSKNKLPSILVYRRYLKLAIAYFSDNNLMDKVVSTTINTPFDVTSLFEQELELSRLNLSSSETNKEINHLQELSNFRVANWNLEKAKKGKKRERQLKKIKQISPDIIGLTELTADLNLPQLKYNLVTKPFNLGTSDLTAGVFSKWPIIKTIDTYDPTQAVCALIDCPLGQVIVYVCIIPYHRSGVSGGKYGNRGYKAWQMHKDHIEYLNNDWQKIQTNHKSIPMISMGDYNQVRDNKPGGYGTKECRDKLTNSLKSNELKCLTEIDFEAKGLLSPDPKSGTTRRNIDHICVSKKLIDTLGKFKVGAWNHFNEKDLQMSDHNGTYVDLPLTT